jgi:hypothetical protein
MPSLDSGNASSSGTAPITGVTPLPVDALPMPWPIAPGEPNPGGDGGRLRILSGTEGDDRLVLDGGFAVGGAGDDTFVLTSTHGDVDGPEHLGTILDFQAGDKLDLRQLGAGATELGRTDDAKGGERVSIDFDGDGKEDGYLIVHERGEIAPDDTGVITPAPTDGEVHILPYPMPGDDGVFTILPFPMPGDGEVAVRVMSGFTVSSDWVV